jgi:hypothetical protein
MRRTLLIATVVLAGSPSLGQIILNGNFSSGTLDHWTFTADANAEPAMEAGVHAFQESLMFRINPGHDGSGGWAGGMLEQSVILDADSFHTLSGNLYIQNLRAGTNLNGGIIAISLGGRELFTTTVGEVPGRAIIHRPITITFRNRTAAPQVLRIRFARPWRNSDPVSIYHWAGHLALTPRCYANCDDSATQPILNIEDFTCFIASFTAARALPAAAQAEHYANCDDSTTEPILNVDDFLCFIGQLAAGCP